VLTELLSDPALPKDVRTLLASLPLLQIERGFWERAGRLRAGILARKRKARVADALIAQSCLDQTTPLVTRDGDVRHFAEAAKLAWL
jgi:predicted nucleic acid-binding protein